MENRGVLVGTKMRKQADRLRICVVEAQPLYIYLYERLGRDARAELLNLATEPQDLEQTASAFSPDVLVIGLRRLDAPVMQEMEVLGRAHPRLPVAVFLASCEGQDLQPLRAFLAGGARGMGVYLKSSLESIEQLYQIIAMVRNGHILLDPAFTPLLYGRKPESPFLEELTPREKEILGLLARGHTNASIARLLFVELKTVEHHINNLYSKLRIAPDARRNHPRVSAARLYLQATGELGRARVAMEAAAMPAR